MGTGASYPLSFPINAGNPTQLNSIAKAAQEIAQQTKLSAGEWKIWKASVEGAAAAGVPMNRAIKDFIKNYGDASARLSQFTSQLKESIAAEEKAAAAAEAASQRRIRAIEREEAARAKAAARALANKPREEEQEFREKFRAAIYATQITSHLSPLGGNLAGIGRHGANLLNIFGSTAGLTATAVTGVAAMGAALLEAAKNAGELAKQQGNAAQRTSLSIKDYSLMAAAAKEAGVAESALTTAQRTLSKALSDNSNEGKIAKDALRELGVSATDAMGGFVGGKKLLEDFDKALAKVSGPEREDLIIKVFGRGGLEMLPLFNGHLRETLGELDKVGAGFNDLSAKSARNFESALDRMSTRFKSFMRDIGVGVAEAIGFEDPAKLAAERAARARQRAGTGDYLKRTTRDPVSGKFLDPATGKYTLDQPAALSLSASDLNQAATRGLPSAFGMDSLNAGQMAARRTQIQQSLSEFGDTKEGKIDAIRRDLQKNEEELKRIGASGSPTAGEAASVPKLQATVLAERAQIKAMEELDAQLKKNTTDLQAFIDAMQKVDINPVEAIYAQRDKLITQPNMSKGQIDMANRTANQGVEAELEKMRSSPEYRFVQKYDGKKGPEAYAEANALVQGMHPDTTGKDIEEGLRRNTEALARNARSAESMQDGMRQISQESARRDAETNTRLQVTFGTAGLTGASRIATSGALELQGAAQSRDQQLSALGPLPDKSKPLSAYMAEDFKKMEQSARIIADFKDKERDIAARTVEQLEQERQRQSDSRSSTFASGLMAVFTHTGEGFGRNLGRSIGETMLTNVGKNFIFNKGGIFDKLQPTLPGGSTLGKLFQGTGLFGGDKSPLVEPANKLDTAAVKLSVAADKLQAVGGGGTGAPSVSGGGSTLSSNAALTTFGSDVNGLTGGSGLGVIGPLITGAGAIAAGATALGRAVSTGGGGNGAGGNNGNGPGAIVGTLNKVTGKIGSFGGLMTDPFGDKGGTPGVNGQPGVDNGRFSGMGLAAAGADVALGGFTAYSQFKKGGARGALGGTSAILGTAAALDPEPISKAVLGIAALGTSLIKGMLGDPKVKRQQEISRNLFNDQYRAPAAQNITSSTNGGFSDIGRDGNIRTSLLSPYTRNTQAYGDFPFRFDVPSVQTSQFGGGGSVIINNHISAMDAGSFETFLKKNSNALVEGVAHGLSFGQSRLPQAIRTAAGQG